MEQRGTVKDTKELIEKHRKITGKYLHLVQDLVASGERIDLEATKAKIEGKYGLKLKPGEISRLAAEPAKESPTGRSFISSEGKIDTEKIESFIEAMRRKYVKPASPTVVPIAQAFFPCSTTPDTSTSLQDASLTAADTQLIDLSPAKVPEVDLMNSIPLVEKPDYSVDLACISFESPPRALSPEPQVNKTMPDLSELRMSRKKLRPKAEDILKDILERCVDKLFSPPELPTPVPISTPVPVQIPEEATSPPPKRKTSPLRSFATFLKGDEPAPEHKPAKTRPGHMKITKAKIDPEAILSKDTEYQQLLLREKELQTRLAALAAEKVEIRASLEAKVM